MKSPANCLEAAALRCWHVEGTRYTACLGCLTAAFEEYHLERCRAGLGQPPISDEAVREAEAFASGYDPRFRVPDELVSLLQNALAGLAHYRDQAMHIAIDTGVVEAYKRGWEDGHAAAGGA